ncbi:AAA family ATPase [Shewanella sp. 3B26]|uniref:AAA family ATPase n=1 Tax=Shewanella zhuhaiensis TaxID=2919576 RepID=A0AAJ1BJS7_9GAMM|nr:AAA family ATPase [Shewanella zhuhaiensis]MCH4296125.1 AAA family ATPase [Shewanella zhuhaiensis]
MEVKNIRLHKVGRFDQLEIPLAPLGDLKTNVTVFVGNNGSGKTSILKSLTTSLSWLVSRIQTDSGKGSPIPELVVNNGAPSAAIDIEVFNHCYGDLEDGDVEAFDENYFRWRIAKTRKGRKGEHKSDYTGASALADHFRSQLSKHDNASLPLIAFYSVERVVIDIPLKIRRRHTFLQLDGYDNSLSQGVDFRRFFEWYREREDSENETGLSNEALEVIKNALGDDEKTWSILNSLKASTRDRQLTAVRAAIYKFMPEFSNLRVRRKPHLHMSIDKNGEPFNVAQLSQGEKSMMALIGDIARRLAVMNPELENPLLGDGIVLIDEVDMHLHPKWQRSIIEQLTSTFPNCQFVLTTHSPLVISDSKNVLTYLIGENEIKRLPPLYGLDANTVLLEIMDTDIRNASINEKLTVLLDAINDTDIPNAKRLIEELSHELPASNLELSKARLLLRKKELKVAKDR